MDNKVKNFIKENIHLIEDNDWEMFYKKANEEAQGFVAEFTQTLLQADINPLNYLNHIPDWYLSFTNIKSFIIPNNVTSIGAFAFRYCSKLTSITIPDGVTSVGNYAFEGCSNLTSIMIPDSVTRIGDFAFFGCSGLTNITIGDSVMSIGESAFFDCSSLTSITFKGTKSQWQAISKGREWTHHVPATVVYCTDGDVKI